MFVESAIFLCIHMRDRGRVEEEGHRRCENKKGKDMCEKTQVMVCNKSRNSKKESWKWDGQEIEDVNKFKY